MALLFLLVKNLFISQHSAPLSLIFMNVIIEADTNNLITKDKPLRANNGRIKGNRIAIKKDLVTIQKKCVLAKELGHYHTTGGDILDQSKSENRKQELRARVWAYNKLIGLRGIVDSYNHSCRSIHETAEYLDVTEEFLTEAVQHYKSKYGICTKLDNYVVYFEPAIAVLELI